MEADSPPSPSLGPLAVLARLAAERPTVRPLLMTEIHHHPILVPPEDGSASAEEFFRENHGIFGLFNFVIDSVLASDYTVYVAGKALAGETWGEISTPAELANRNPGTRTIYLRRNRQALLEMFLGRAVDNFQKYLTDVIREVLKQQPAMLKSKQNTVSLEEVLQFDSLDEFVRQVIESKVNALSYQGFRELQDWCSEKGIPLVIPHGKEEQIVEAIATRNLITHNRGIVDQKYLRLVSSPRFGVGQARRLEVDDLFGTLELLNEAVGATDHAVVAKFRLPKVPIRRRDHDATKAKAEAPKGTESVEVHEPVKTPEA
jgi:hypothetical protein